MKRLVAPVATCFLLVACDAGGPDAEDYLMREGAWGWGNGAGCEGLSDAWVIDGRWADIYRDGERVDRALVQARQLSREEAAEGVTGEISGMTWYFVARDPEARGTLVQHQVSFTVSEGRGRAPYLFVPPRRTLLDPETKERRRIDDPRKGDRFAPCPEDMPVPEVQRGDPEAE